MKTQDVVYVLVDGENIDRTLGQILDAKPRPEQRPRWEVIRKFAETTWGKRAQALFFLNARRGLPGTFIQALRQAGFVPIPLTGDAEQKVVDIGINRTLEAIKKRPGADVLLVSHDQDFSENIHALAEEGGRRLGVLGFQEYLGGEYFCPKVELYDLEADARAFECGPLPRTRVLKATGFDVERFL